jgi:hypothetical protein
VAAGAVLTWSDEKPSALVAIDVRTGKERWRLPMPNEERPDVVLAGDLALVYRSIGATAVDVATGRQRWTRRLCFRSNVATVAKPHVGVGMCAAPDPPADETDHGPRLVWKKNMAVAVDLDSGRERWRVPTGWPSEALAAAGGSFYVAADTAPVRQKSVTVSALDPRTGKALRSFVLPNAPNQIRVMPGDAKRALFIGADIVAVNLADGRVLWQAPGPPPARQMRLQVPWPELRAGRLLAWNGNHVRELDLRTGAEVASWDPPPGLTAYNSQTVRPAPAGGALVIKDRDREPALALRFAGPGAAPTLAVLPVTYENVLAVEDDVLVVHNGHHLEGYATFDPIASEAAGLDAPARVRAILERQPWRWRRGSTGKKEQAEPLAELRSVKGFEPALAQIALDVNSPVHDAAVDAVAVTRIPEAAEVLLAEIGRPMGFSPLTGDRRRDEHAKLLLNNPMLRRSDLVASLADLDDPKAADVLATLLSADESVIGLGRRDWETWGGWVESGYGKKSWAATDSEPSAAFSVCLQAPAGRPEAHAAIYRMLARLGRPRDVEALRRFDAANGAASGWTHICDADDALTTTYVDRSGLSNGLGLCRGWDAGDTRVTQSEVFWLRRRRPDGSFGAPAWAFDPGGDTSLQRRVMHGARQIEGGEIEIRYGDNEIATVSPKEVFADRDGDGLPDLTEAAFGTDPARADTDGDGIPDGRDPAPLARTSTTEAARVSDEVVRFVTTFRMGGPVGVYADPTWWGGAGGIANAGVALYRPLAGPVPRCDAEHSFCQGRYLWGARGRNHYRGPGLPPEPATEGKRHCEMSFAIESVAVQGAKAEAVAIWPAQNGNGQRVEHKLELRKVAGTWRVTEDRGPMF